ncbi:MAG: ABC transporter ATP-binding protein, partial [Deltaproteobacteria bacterium]|nr:ABC transporter ATP-binding protein [Deltaproteobacteria bacterium]
MLEVEGLAIRRGGRVVVDDMALTVDAGEIAGVVGANGCGKSTLLSCIAGVLAPREGSVRIAGASVWGTRRERAAARRALGYVPEG